MKLEIELNGRAELALEEVADHFDADPSEVAKEWVKAQAGQEFAQLVATEGNEPSK